MGYEKRQGGLEWVLCGSSTEKFISGSKWRRDRGKWIIFGPPLPMVAAGGCIRDLSITILKKLILVVIGGLGCQKRFLHAKRLGRSGL
jgi:hypothetical protein